MSFVTMPQEVVNARSVRTPKEEWPEPAALPGLPPVPPWDDRLLPSALRPWLTDVSQRIQCPPEYPAIGAIVALGSVIGRACAIRPKRHDDWSVIPNLWGSAVGSPSAMKTPAVREAMRPLSALARKAAEEHAERDYERQAVEARLKSLKLEMQKAAKKGGDLTAYKEDFDEIEAQAQEANAERRFIVYDATVEKLGELLRDSSRGLLLFRDELAGWLRLLDKVGRENDRSFYLEAWNGDGPYVYDRIGRGTVVIDAACVSILGTIQPGPLGAYLRAAVDGGGGDDGLIQRFQLMVYPDQSKAWENVDRWPNSEAKRNAAELFERLAHADPQDLGADVSDPDVTPFVRFTDKAQKFFDDWRNELENRLRTGDEHPAIEAHLVKYRSLLPSLALIFQLVDHETGPVALESAERAAAWCALLEAHARRIYGAVVAPDLAGAKTLLGKIRSGKLEHPFQARDVYHHGWAGLAGAEPVKAAIATLGDFGWVRTKVAHTAGRPRTDIHVHPCLRKGER